MAKRPHNKGKKCVRMKSVVSSTTGQRVKVCASYKRKAKATKRAK